MEEIKFINSEAVPLEMHKARIIQKIALLPVEDRVKANEKAGNNAHLLQTNEVFLDMLTDSGTNAMIDKQLAAMMEADDAYAGSASFSKLESVVQDLFDMKYFVPAHQGRACEHLLCRVLITPGMTVAMNHHFTTTRGHVKLAKGELVELLKEEGFQAESSCPFKGDMDIQKLENLILEKGAENIAFVRMEAGTNLIGGQPISLENIQAVGKICKKNHISYILDASLLSDNLYFIKKREESCRKMSIQSILKKISSCFDIIYFSARKLTSSRGGGIAFRKEEDYLKVRDLLPIYEGFLTYGGISIREIESMAVGLSETVDEHFISQGPIFIEEMTNLLIKQNVPVVTPPGGLGVHLDAKRFLPHIPAGEYPAAALHVALYLVSGIRGTERGTLSEDRNENGEEVFAKMELLRLALPRRVFTLSHIKYAVDRISWLYQNRTLIHGLEFVEEPETLRFFFGRLKATDDWQKKLVKKFKEDFGDSL
ncbi:tryptophanase [Lachnospiraceae bacterium OttesenSCG-928-D06]|nr:tryptophanase [Lachnospiraceae bacterium OttesenSCG-928-D06]